MDGRHLNLRDLIKQGLLSGIIALSLSMIGMVELFNHRQLIYGILTLGQVFLFLAPVVIAYVNTDGAAENGVKQGLLTGTIIGLFTAIPLVLLIVIASVVDLRQYLVNVSADLISMLTFGQGVYIGSVLLVALMIIVGMVASSIKYIPDKYRKPLFRGIVWTLGVSLFSEVLSERVRTALGTMVTKLIFKSKATQPVTALVLFLMVSGGSYAFSKMNIGLPLKEKLNSNLPDKSKRLINILSFVLLLILLIILPKLLGSYLSEVVNNVGIYVLMGLGLNIVVGFAGLLDLGYVAFFAIGAYTMAILTSHGALGIAHFSFWGALPFSVAAAVLAGIMLGVPVLRMRGDYLAIVTLGFGEIIRVLANSDLLKNYIGGAQGILQIPKPVFCGNNLSKPQELYFVILVGVLIAVYISTRLRDSRLGRQWMAMREDEDVAEAMGINLVNSKLLAFAIGAGFSGLSGAIFASKLSSIFPHSFNLLISINVLSLIIVGGMGSIPGVVVGAAILVGLPELLREFKEYRLLMYGGLLIVMMLAKPEGFWPSAIQKRELEAYRDTDKKLSNETPMADAS